MTHKGLPWIISVLAVGVAAVAVLRPTAVAPRGDGDSALEARMTRLEARVPTVERSLVRAGAQLGAAALAGAAAEPARRDDETPAQAKEREQREAAEQEAKETRMYDRMDLLARTGGGAAAAAQLRKNIDQARALATPKSPKLEFGAVDCSDELCRVEVTVRGRDAVMAATRALLPQMGAVSMRPLSGPRAIYYVSAAGRDLPGIEN